MITHNIFKTISNNIKKRVFISSTTCKYSNYSYCNTAIILKNNMLMPQQTFTGTYLSTRNIFFSKIMSAKSKIKEKKAKVQNLDFRELNDLYDFEKVKEQYNKSIQNMKQEFMDNFNLRTSIGAIESLKVHMNGKQYELQELAQISRKPKLVVIDVNFPTSIPFIMKAVSNSKFNINPQQDGTTIYLPIPVITKDYREKLIKNSKAVYIKYRDEIKNERSKVIKILKKSQASPDSIERTTAVLEKFTDTYLDEISNILKSKQNELSGD